jgi:hypothetical protein
MSCTAENGCERLISMGANSEYGLYIGNGIAQTTL